VSVLASVLVLALASVLVLVQALVLVLVPALVLVLVQALVMVLVPASVLAWELDLNCLQRVSLNRWQCHLPNCDLERPQTEVSETCLHTLRGQLLMFPICRVGFLISSTTQLLCGLRKPLPSGRPRRVHSCSKKTASIHLPPMFQLWLPK
jgi:hypothetical protein